MGLEQWGASEQYYEIASVHPEYELGRVISSVRQEEISTIPTNTFTLFAKGWSARLERAGSSRAVRYGAVNIKEPF